MIHLNKEDFIRVKPSKLGGVGLFAVRNISKNTEIEIWDETANDKFYSYGSVKGIKKQMCELICVATKKGYWCPSSFTNMSIGWLINHSSNPNLKERKIRKKWSHYTMRDIKKDEEITLNYQTLDKNINNINFHVRR
mgnify:CR=1 FL=1